MSDDATYTTAIIAAVPSLSDPVHQVVAEDAHITLQFLGEAEKLGELQVIEILQLLGLLSVSIPPFTVTVSGTAELGEDKAQVLLIESDLLTKIRETIGTNPTVAEIVGNVEQFPNWIPHLTLAYEGEVPNAMAFGEVEIGSLELWLGEAHETFPLTQATAAVTAAGVTGFDETLHPRGADGRFIEKFGIIKYLTGANWQYGKVVGIFKDPQHLGTKITVTPSDLSGNAKGENIVLNPNQVYRAPKKIAHLTIASKTAQKIGGQGGSNPGGLYKIPTSGPATEPEKFYVKTPKTKSHGNNEALANALYEEAGVPVPEVDFHPDGNLYSKIIDGQQDMASQLDNPEWTLQVQRNFAVDAWLGNRDVFGLTYDNVLTDAQGVPWRIDNGGALLYRAMGEKKTDFGSKVTELDIFRTGKKAKIYGPKMPKAAELDGAERVVAISPGQIDEMVAAHGMPQSLADTLKARRVYIADYYGLPLPESVQPAEAEGPTTAPLVDAPDLAEFSGKTRNWFKGSMTHLGILGQTGDVVEFPDGSSTLYGVDLSTVGAQLSIVGTQQELLGWQQKYGPDAQILFRKKASGGPRPDHGSKIMGSDLAKQAWKRGDEISTEDGQLWSIKGWNSDTGAVLVQSGDGPPTLLDTLGSHSTQIYEVHRWDAPAVDTLGVTPVPPTPQVVHQLEVEAPTPSVGELQQAPAPLSDQETAALHEVADKYGAPQPGKTGQAAQAEAVIKADLNEPMPAGSGTPAPPKTSAPGGAKTMVLGDGTEASTGDAVTSKKDGKTYTFVKPKGQYAVVTDPNGEDPNKQLLKLASTMTQPDKAPAADVSVEAPKTATGEVPVVGMQAQAKDGWAGTITMISPDGKFVFITDPVTNKRKRKSTGTVSITGGTPAAAEAPKKLVGPIKDYGTPPKKAAVSWPLDWDDAADLGPVDMVVVGYADGTHGLEPYTGQPTDSLLTNANGKIATSGTIKAYQGTIDAAQFTQATGGDKTQNYQVIWHGTVHQTDGTTGPNGGLVLWDREDPTDYAFELPVSGQQLSIVYNQNALTPLPDYTGISSFQQNDNIGGFNPPPLWQDEAKPLSAWKDQLAAGTEISLDGENWLTVKQVYPAGAAEVADISGTTTTLMPTSTATYVIKAPELKDAATTSAWKPTTSGTGIPDDVPGGPATKKIGDLIKGDVVTDGNGETSIIQSVSDLDPSTQQIKIQVLGEDWATPADPNFEFDHHGNINQNPVNIPAGVVAPFLYPGATLQFNSTDVPAQVVTYPEKLANGNWQVAVFQNGDSDNLALVEIGDPALGAHIANEAVLSAELGAFVSSQESDVDPVKLNSLFNQAKTVDTEPVDHHAQMTDQGLPFGSAQYPIYFNPTDDSYYRQGPNGVEGWENGAWTPDPDQPSITPFEKAWDGAPFEGQLQLPSGKPTTMVGDDWGNPLGYKPEPGELLQVWTMHLASGDHSVLIAFPDGNPNGTAYMVVGGKTTKIYAPYKVSAPMMEGWQKTEDFSGGVTIHDPFAEPTDSPGVTNHEGPTPPSALAQALAKYGWTPEPGQQFWMATKSDGPGQAVLLKQPDGTWQQINYSQLKTKKWEPEELLDPVKSGADTHYTWTFVPAGQEGPKPVDGMPADFAPFVPGEGQSVLKVTLPNGKANVYLQKQPGAGWYALGSDGVVHEASDAVKSDHVVQLKLAGKGSQAAKYELLHPKPEGDVTPGSSVPTFSNSTGSFTPEPHQKVVALSSYPGDPDPWFYTQDQPGGDWTPVSINSMAGGQTDVDMKSNLLSNVSGGPGTSWTVVYNGDGKPVDTPDGQGLPAFEGYVPQEGDKVISYKSQFSDEPYFYVQQGGTGSYKMAVNGQLSGSQVLQETDVPANLGPEHGNDYAQVWPPVEEPGAGQQTFSGYAPKLGDKIISDNAGNQLVQQQSGGAWYALENGQVNQGKSIPDGSIHQMLDQGKVTQVWPTATPATAPGQTPSAPASGTPSFGGYTPLPSEKVALDQGGQYHVQGGPGQRWFPVMPSGEVDSEDHGTTDAEMQDNFNSGFASVVHGGTATAGPAGIFGGYQTETGDNVVQLSGPLSTETFVQKGGTGNWFPIKDGQPELGSEITQSALDWAVSTADSNTFTITDLQGSHKGGLPEAGQVEQSKPVYAGVTANTVLTPGTFNFGTYTPSQSQELAILKMDPLAPGQSLYVFEDPTLSGGNTVGSTVVLVRHSDGQWSRVFPNGEVSTPIWDSDVDLEEYVAANHYQLHKAQFQAPAKAPQLGPPPTFNFAFDGWQGKTPDPASFGFLADASDAAGMKKGDWIFIPGSIVAQTGLFIQLGEDLTPDNLGGFTAEKWAAVSDGTVGESVEGNPGWTLTGNTGGIFITGGKPQVPANAPSAPSPAAPVAPAAPSYPGAVKPSQEDINAWGGDLTKDGHIPTAQMFVTGKGPMSGKIISVSKDKTKATVLTSDGKKTTRLISALRTDPSANYQAYGPKVEKKDIPSGMPVAVDTPKEALAKTAQDGKFRAILTGHPGVSGGAMTVTKTTGPSGKVYNRIHLTLTPDQRGQLAAMLAGSGEKGDWVKSSKPSDQVAIGDELPMRLSSTKNPDGTPRWKVDPETKPPTHTVTKVEDEPGGTGVKLVTMKNKTTGEEIVSRFHTGKSLAIYTWDPNKPKTMMAGALNLSETAKAQGWQLVSDGGISAIKGGADKGQLYHEPGTVVSASALGQLSSTWKVLRNTSADGVVIEIIDPKGSSNNSSTGTTVISIPAGMDETALGGALARMGIDYSPMTQDGAKQAVRGTLRTLLSLDTSDVDTPKHFTDEKLFEMAGQTMGISDLGWQDVLLGVDESTGKTSFFWSDRARNALAAKAQYNLIYRAADNASASQIVANVKYGSASAMMKKTTGMLDGSGSVGNGNGASTDNSNHAGHGSYASASKVSKLPSKNSFASYKAGNMMVYHRAEAVLGRIMDYRLASSDAFGKGQGEGANHLKAATTMNSVRDFFMGGGLPSEAIGYIAVDSAAEREKAIAQLKADGFPMVNGRAVEDIVITKQKAVTMTVDDLPPVTNPSNARPITELPMSYDTPAAEAPAAGEAA